MEDQLLIVSGVTIMGEQRVPYAGLTIETKKHSCTIRLYPFDRVVRIHNTRRIDRLPSIPSATVLEESWPKYIATIQKTLAALQQKEVLSHA